MHIIKIYYRFYDDDFVILEKEESDVNSRDFEQFLKKN